MQLLEGMATPESGTGKYYKEGQPTKKQLEVRAQQEKNREAANRGRMPDNLADAYLQVYEEKSTGDKLKDIAKKKQAKYDAQPQEYKNNPAFGDESHHSNAKNK